jgi:hypothetical protein
MLSTQRPNCVLQHTAIRVLLALAFAMVPVRGTMADAIPAAGAVYLPVLGASPALAPAPPVPTRTPPAPTPAPHTAWPTPEPTLATPTAAPTRTHPSVPLAHPTLTTEPEPPSDVYGDCVVTTTETRFGPDSDWYTDIVTYNAQSAPMQLASASHYADDYDSSLAWWHYRDGLLITQEEDHGADGSIDERITREYDAWRRLVDVVTDLRADGDIDSDVRFTYNEFGDLTHVSLQNAATGIGALLERNTYDAVGHPIRTELDFQSDGSPTLVIEHDWRSNLLVRDTMIDPAGAIAPWIACYLYDSARRLVRIETRDADTWALHEWTDFSYETHGWLASREHYRRDLEYSVYYTYDGAGRVTEIQYPIYGGRTTRVSRCLGDVRMPPPTQHPAEK